MPGKPEHPCRIRIRATDDKKYESIDDLNMLKSKVFVIPHLELHAAGGPADKAHQEVIVAARKQDHIDKLREKLASAHFEEIEGDTEINIDTSKLSKKYTTNGSAHVNKGYRSGGRDDRRSVTKVRSSRKLLNKPYGFVPLPESFQVDAPVWHDGEGSRDRISGEIRFELTTLSPTLVGWEQQQAGDKSAAWPIPTQSCGGECVKIDIDGNDTWSEETVKNKSVLYPLQAPWGKRPVIIPGDSIKGLLRHEMGALLGAPMQLVAERSYSYRPNLSFPDHRDNSLTRVLEPRFARVLNVKSIIVDGDSYPVPEELDILKIGRPTFTQRYRSDSFEPYKGGLFGGKYAPDPQAFYPNGSRTKIRTVVDVSNLRGVEHRKQSIDESVVEQYKATLQHLFNQEHGHFSSRHPSLGNDRIEQEKFIDAVRAAAKGAFEKNDIICVEWDTRGEGRVVSFGWHYYYRWAYIDTVRTKGGVGLRPGLGLLPEEKLLDEDGAPERLSLVRRLFGFTEPSDTKKKANNYDQLMGRVSINAACEVVRDNETDQQRFEEPTFLKELGGPKPSAVEHYLEQPHANDGRGATRPLDQARLVTYGDAKGYDTPGELAGRKFYLDRGSNTPSMWADGSKDNRENERSTLALRASKRGRRFRFTLMFRDLDRWEAAAIMVALCPHQFRQVLGGTHADGYCSKLGYARPLGWGSVRIEAKELLLLQHDSENLPELQAQSDLAKWVKEHHRQTQTQTKWLEIHRRNHPDAGDYPREGGEIFTYHQKLRSNHSKLRRYRK